jgi:hypothetical protein
MNTPETTPHPETHIRNESAVVPDQVWYSTSVVKKKTYYRKKKGGDKLTAVAGRRTIKEVRRPTHNILLPCDRAQNKGFYCTGLPATSCFFIACEQVFFNTCSLPAGDLQNKLHHINTEFQPSWCQPPLDSVCSL